MSAGIFGSWRKQTTQMAEKRYFSETPGIWTDRVTRAQRKPQVTDRELLKRRGSPQMDCCGNLLTGRREDMVRIAVERAMQRLTPAERAAVTPRAKWDLIDSLVRGKS